MLITDTVSASRTLNPAAQRLLDQIVDGDAEFEDLPARIIGGGAASERVGLVDGRVGILQITAVTLDADARVSTAFLTLAVDGRRDAEIAKVLFLSPYTVKQHLRSAYAKLNVRFRVESTRLATDRPGPFPGTDPYR